MALSIKDLMISTGLLLLSLLIHLQAQAAQLVAETCNTKHPQAQCYRLQTTEQAQGQGAAVSIPVQFLPARQQALAKAPVVWLNGGPGVTNLNPPMPDWVFDRFDVLVIGYRGIDGSPRLDCPLLKQKIKQVQKDDSTGFLSNDAFALWRNEVSACQQGLEAQGLDTNAYGTLQVVADIEQVRKLLGFEQISLLSASYGTRIAWYYDQLHPGKVFRNLLLSGNPTGGFYFDPASIDQELQRLSQWCAEDAECRAQTPDLYQTIQAVLRNPPKKAWGVNIDADHLRIATFMLLYSRQTWPLLADAMSKAARGNSSGLAAMLKFPNPMTSNDWVWGTFFSAGSIDYQPERDYAEELDRARKHNGLGSPLSELIFEGLSPGWQMQPQSAPTLTVSVTPTLILASQVDVATPITRVEQHWMPWLSNAALLDINGAGHAPDHILAGGEPLSRHLQQFLAGGEPHSAHAFGAAVQWRAKFSLSWLVYGVWAGIGLLGAGLSFVVFRFVLPLILRKSA